MRLAILLAAIAVPAVLLIPALADPTIAVYTDKNYYETGDTIEISLSAQNYAAPMSVAVYVGLLTPQGPIYTYGSYGMTGWSSAIEAWIPSITVPSPFYMERTAYFWVQVPSVMPPIQQPGNYYFASVLAYPGTFTPVCSTSMAPFAIVREISMVSIPSGSFLMGSPIDETGRNADESPQRVVNVSAFQMSATEITEKQWEDAMGWNDCYYGRGVNYPVENVTWFDCVNFCNRLSEAAGLATCYTIMNAVYDGNHITSAYVDCSFGANGYRLPTEAEWEYACRAGTTTRFYTGDSDSDIDRAGWHYGNSGLRKREVAQTQVNGWGLYDMPGNVWEWCWDWYVSDYYGTRPDPDTDPTGAISGYLRVARGGSWDDGAQYCRSACRHGFWPNYRYCVGLRIVRSVN